MTDVSWSELTQDDCDQLMPLLSLSQPRRPGLQAVLYRFGIQSLRSEQKQALDALLSGRDVFLCLPTGGGKSLCFQTPSLLIGDRGLTVVVSPLVSLMANQTRILRDKGIECGLINSTVSPKQASNLQAALLDESSCTIRLLYTTPESFKTDSVLLLLRKLYVTNRIDLFAIDEAHCISTWGHSFRPSYQDLSAIRTKFPSVPILACTATATKLVADDIMKTLQMHSDSAVVKASFNRPNIYYKVVWSSSLEEKDVLALVQRFGRGRGGIIYCSTKAGCDRLAEVMLSAGLPIGAYHAGLPNGERQRVQSLWETGEIDIVVATIAFGMGIHRDDVSFIVHMNLPKSIENYYQETGRAGRNGKAAVAVLYYSKSDEQRTRNLLRLDSNPCAMKSFGEMVEFCNSARCHRRKLLEYFGERLEPTNPASTHCCDFCDDSEMFERNRRSNLVSPSSSRFLAAFVSKHSKREPDFLKRPSDIALVDEPEQEDSAGIYRLQDRITVDAGPIKRRKQLTVGITDIQRNLCRRRLLLALQQNRVAAGVDKDCTSLNSLVESIEKKIFDGSSAKSDYMNMSRDSVISIQSSSNTLSLYEDPAKTSSELDLHSVQTRLCNLSSSMAAPGAINSEEIDLITNALGKYFMTVEVLRSSRIGKTVNELLKQMKSAGLDQSHKQQFAGLSSLLSKWKDTARHHSIHAPP